MASHDARGFCVLRIKVKKPFTSLIKIELIKSEGCNLILMYIVFYKLLDSGDI